MLIAPFILESARARHLDLEREARHERLLRLARTGCAKGSGAFRDGACCPSGCCGPSDVAAATERVADAPTRSIEPARRRPRRARPGIAGPAAWLLRALRSVVHTPRGRCAPRGASARTAA